MIIEFITGITVIVFMVCLSIAHWMSTNRQANIQNFYRELDEYHARITWLHTVGFHETCKIIKDRPRFFEG